MNTRIAGARAFGLILVVSALGWGVGTSAWARPAGGDMVQVQTPLDGQGTDQHETNLGDLVADAAQQTGSADVAVVAADEITAETIPAGSMPISRLVGALTYAADPSDTLVVLKLTGAQLRQVMQRSVSRAPQGFDGFLQVAGVKLQYDPAKPEGKRITQIQVGDAPLNDTQSYLVATTRSVADGSFGYFQFWTPQDIVQDTHITLAAGLAAYLSAHRSLDVTLQNRITP